MKNETFIGSDPTWANACVGDNGQPNYIEYSKGYSKAASLLLDHVLKMRGTHVDHLIYPICFNMRHSIELRIKGAIKEIKLLSEIKKIPFPSFDLISSHNIGNIWQFFKENSNLLDTRFQNINRELNDIICDIASIDPTGQTFRYPKSNDNRKHLVEQKIINCYVLKLKFEKLENNLDNLMYLTDSLIDEYKLGTFTSKLSRAQIFQFAKELPPYNQWTQNSFQQIKTELKMRYCLSNNDFTKIVNHIKNNYELCYEIGLRKPLAYLNNTEILELCDIWTTYFAPDFRNFYKSTDSNLVCDKEDTNFIVDFFENGALHKKGIQLLENKLSPNYVADLQALYYLSIDHHQYSENYIFRYKYFLQEAQYKDLSHSLDHLLSKGVFLEELIKSLLFLNQTDLAEEIITIYNLEMVFDFLPEARARKFFKSSELMGY